MINVEKYLMRNIAGTGGNGGVWLKGKYSGEICETKMFSSKCFIHNSSRFSFHSFSLSLSFHFFRSKNNTLISRPNNEWQTYLCINYQGIIRICQSIYH